ncbi:MAG: outer membrane beta-barrel protein [Methyloprofundus sp.]|nr:outer membrane beta-barrel protein [Methyloprofundus sp.]
MNNKSVFKRTLLSSAILLTSFQVAAGEPGMIEALSDFSINNTSFMQKTGFEVGLWASGGVTGNSNGNTNAPVLFNDRVNEFTLNQLNFYIERAVNAEGDSWDIGGRMDFMYGTDARFTQASGWDSKWNNHKNGGYYDIAMPQLYVEVFAPIGNGITAKLGHFYTTIGNEVVTAPDNFFYSHAYTMLYAEPFTHTGALFSYDINDNFSVNGGAVMGWDNMTENAGAWSFLGGGSWTSDSQASSVTVQLISGNQSDTESGNTTMYSIVATHDFTDDFHYLLQHDFGTQKYANNESDNWFGINQYFTYDITDKLSVGLRAEWFNDKDNARVSNTGANYLAASIGVNYSPVTWFKLRPEIRYDWADEDVFNSGVDHDQIAIAMDMIVNF